MKVEVLKRFVQGGVVVRHPGEVLEVSPEVAEQLVERGIVKRIKPPRKRKEPSEDKAASP